MKKYNSRTVARLADCRKRLHLTQEELAELLSYTDSTISDIETGKRIPSLEVTLETCNIFGEDISELLCGDDPAMPDSFHNRETERIRSVRKYWKAAGRKAVRLTDLIRKAF